MSKVSTPALLGDGSGRYKVMVVGNSGTGKSTLSEALAKKMGIAYISLDKLNWNPGWQETPAAEMRIRIRDALAESPQGWVVDGNYTRKIGTIVSDEATDIIWLDPPLLLYFPRIALRTFLRLFRLKEPCSPGCPEIFTETFFSKNSILWWCLTNHVRVRRRNQEMMRDIGLGIGLNVVRRRMRRIGGWGSELGRWWIDVDLLLAAKKSV